MEFFDEHGAAREAAQSDSVTRRILEELAGGKKSPRFVRIFTQTELNREASIAAGHRVYREVPYILAKHSMQDDGVARRLTEADKERFPRAWAHYQATEGKAQAASVDLLPAATPGLAQELKDMGLGELDALLAYEGDLPNHLLPVLKQAQMWQQLQEPEESHAA